MNICGCTETLTPVHATGAETRDTLKAAANTLAHALPLRAVVEKEKSS